MDWKTKLNEKLIESVKKHEGCELEAYQDTEGVWTIGYGRNLQELTISEAEAERWLREDLERAYREAVRFPEWEYLDTVARRNVFVEMVFNLGAPRLRGFKRMLAAIRERNWDHVSIEMLDSRWADQVGQRAVTLSHLMRRGQYEVDSSIPVDVSGDPVATED